MTLLEQISHETMVFMRGKYRLDEIGDGKEELKFKQGQKTIVTIYLHDDKFTFLIIFGKKERELFEIQKSKFSKYVCDCYDHSKTYHDGKRMFMDVSLWNSWKRSKSSYKLKRSLIVNPFQRKTHYIPNVASVVICVSIIFIRARSCGLLWKHS